MFRGLPLVFQYAYSTSTAQWINSSLSLTTVGAAAVTTSGRVFSSGGINGDLWNDPTQQSWSFEPQRGMDALPPMLIGRRDHAVAALGNRIVIVGGLDYGYGFSTGSAEQLTLVTGCDIHEPDATKASATPWLMLMDRDNQPLVNPMSQAKICTAKDVDNFVLVDKLDGFGYSVQMTPPTGKDYELLLLDPTGTSVLERSSLVGSVTETVRVPDAGVGFYVRVRSQNGTFSSSVPYRLVVVP